MFLKVRFFLILMVGIILGGCASLKPLNEGIKIPKSLPPEVQAKFSIEEPASSPPEKAMVTPVASADSTKSVVPSKTKKNSPSITPKVIKETSVIPPVRTFNPSPQKIIFAVYGPLNIRAGTLTVQVMGEKTINHQSVIYVRANIYNSAFFASIFKVNLLVESFIDPYEFKSIRYQVSGQEGSLNKSNIELYDYEQKNIIVYKQNTKDSHTEESQSTYPVLTNSAQDILSAFFKLSSLDFNQKTHAFWVASNDKLKSAQVIKLSEETFNHQPYLVLGLTFDPSQNPQNQKIWFNPATKSIDKILAITKWGHFTVLRVDHE